MCSSDLLAGVAAVRDTAGRAKVTGLMVGIRAASGLEASVLQSAEETFQRYEGTFGADTDCVQAPRGLSPAREKLPVDVQLGLLQQAFPERCPSP